MEWLCFLTVPEDLPEPAVLLCAEHLPALPVCRMVPAQLAVCPENFPPYMRFLIYGSVGCQQLSTLVFTPDLHVPVESKAMAHERLLQEEAQGRGKTDFKPRVSQKAEIVGSCTEKMKKIKKRKGDLNGSKPAEWYKGEKQCWHETVPAAFHRPGTANLSQEVKQRKGVK